MNFYHVTDALKGMSILKDGLKPYNQTRDVPISSEYSEPEYIYLFKEFRDAKVFAQAFKEKSEMPVWILKVDVPESIHRKFERDYAGGMEHFSSYKYRKTIPSKYIKLQSKLK